jgi:hypothetical protein
VIDIQQTEITKGKDRDQEFLDNVLMLEWEDNKFEST